MKRHFLPLTIQDRIGFDTIEWKSNEIFKEKTVND